MSAHPSKGIRFVPKMPPLLGHAPSDPLLGQSFLSRFKSWSIDNQRQARWDILGSPPQDIETNRPAATPSDVPIDPIIDALGMPVSMASAVDA